MQIHKFPVGKTVYLMALHYYENKGDRRKVGYTFGRENAPAIFSGLQYSPSPLYSPEGYDSAIGLLGFLTLKKGDTDEDYFDDYTPEQLAFSQSMDCEELAVLVSDHEEGRRNNA